VPVDAALLLWGSGNGTRPLAAAVPPPGPHLHPFCWARAGACGCGRTCTLRIPPRRLHRPAVLGHSGMTMPGSRSRPPPPGLGAHNQLVMHRDPLLLSVVFFFFFFLFRGPVEGGHEVVAGGSRHCRSRRGGEKRSELMRTVDQPQPHQETAADNLPIDRSGAEAFTGGPHSTAVDRACRPNRAHTECRGVLLKGGPPINARPNLAAP